MTIENLTDRTGVWVEDGKVYRRDSDKEYSARVYTPISPDLLPKVLEKARILHGGASMESWSAAVETAQDETLRQLQELIEK